MTAAIADACLVDTNVLLRGAQPTHPLCPQATNVVSRLLRQKDSVFFCSQNIAEFRNVAARPVEVNGLGFSHEEALQEHVQNVKVYDARLVAVMSVYAIDRVRTFNIADFKRYDTVSAIYPASMLA
jgi:predicted nucleic acid-binding protein